MKVTVLRLRQIVREALRRGSQPEEAYDIELMDDPALQKKSVYVPDEVKGKIRKWMKDMKMSSS